MTKLIESLVTDTKKIGRITALVIVLGVAGTLSIMMALHDTTDMPVLLDKWMDIAIIAIMFYFTSAKTK